ncbi:unnamed protein product [Diplocarpon coronariae]
MGERVHRPRDQADGRRSVDVPRGPRYPRGLFPPPAFHVPPTTTPRGGHSGTPWAHALSGRQVRRRDVRLAEAAARSSITRRAPGLRPRSACSGCLGHSRRRAEVARLRPSPPPRREAMMLPRQQAKRRIASEGRIHIASCHAMPCHATPHCSSRALVGPGRELMWQLAHRFCTEASLVPSPDPTLAPPARGSWDAGASATAAAKMSSGLRAAMSPSRGQMQLLLRYAESSGPAPSSTRSPYPSSRHKPLVRPAEMDRMIRIWNHRPPDPEIRDTCVCKCTQPSLAAAVVLDLVEDKACREGWQYLAAAVHSSVIRAATRCKPG